MNACIVVSTIYAIGSTTTKRWYERDYGLIIRGPTPVKWNQRRNVDAVQSSRSDAGLRYGSKRQTSPSPWRFRRHHQQSLHLTDPSTVLRSSIAVLQDQVRH